MRGGIVDNTTYKLLFYQVCYRHSKMPAKIVEQDTPQPPPPGPSKNRDGATADNTGKTCPHSQQQTLRWKTGAPYNKNLIPWVCTGERSIFSLYRLCYYACRIECIHWLLQPAAPNEKNGGVVRVYLEAWGEWDLQHPNTSTFRIILRNNETGTVEVGEKVRGRWVLELSKEEEQVWGHYKGYLELPMSFFDGAARATLAIHFVDVPGLDDYPAAALLKFLPALSECELDRASVLESLFHGIGRDGDIEEDLTPNSPPFPVHDNLDTEKEWWTKVCP